MVDKDAKIRDVKRQNVLLNSKIKLLEEEMENLHEKIDHTLKERNKLRKEVHLGLNQLSEGMSRSASPTLSIASTQHNLIGLTNHINLTGSLGNLNLIANNNTQSFIEPFKTSSISTNLYSGGFVNNWDRYKLTDPVIRGGLSNNNFNANAFDLSINSFLAGTSTNNDFNSSNTTPRSYR
jgi:hypothetical protein